MSLKNSTVNFVIHDANGQPQMVKVVQNINNQSFVQNKIKSNPIKIIKLSTAAETNYQSPVYKTVKLLASLKCKTNVQVPVETLKYIQKGTTPEQLPIEFKVEDHFVPHSIDDLKYSEPVPKLLSIPTKAELDTPTKADDTEKKNQSLTMSHASRRRHDSDNDAPAEYTTKRRKHADKVGKGLRHFSMKVCEKVRNKGFTSYNEVADELVLEFANGMHGSGDSQQYDQKNIRRRVYDALNVLMAMNIISKEKKEIRWIGLPSDSVQECTALENEKSSTIQRIQQKTQQLQELLLQHISFKSLVERNKEAENKGVKPSPSSAIHLPFIVVNTSDKALIDCSISNDKTEYMFNFNKRFQIHDDIDILKRMGLLMGLDKGECSDDNIEIAKKMVPKALEYYVEQMGRGITTKIASILEDEDPDDDEDELDEDNEGEFEEEAEGNNEYSDDSSEVDV